MKTRAYFWNTPALNCPSSAGPCTPAQTRTHRRSFDAGGIGIIQPISMQYVHGHDLREGIRYMRTLTDKPIGFNAIVEKSSRST